MSDFIHLHCHSEYSLLQSTIRIQELCSRAVELGMSAVALTDTNNLHGAIEFYESVKEQGLKPIIGCEIGLLAGILNSQEESTSISKNYGLTLLAINKTGFHNLIKLSSLGYMNNPSQKPGVTREELVAYSSGLIALSGGFSGEVSHVLEHFGMDKALNAAMGYSEIFSNRFYLEMQACELLNQKKLSQQLAELSQSSGLPLIATNDCRYLYEYESEYFETLLRLEKTNLPHKSEQESFPSAGLHFTTPDEMQKAFAHIPQALENTIHISRLCNLELNLSSGSYFMSPPLKGETWEDKLRSNAQNGLERRIHTSDMEAESEKYYQRLDKELNSICSHGLAEHFVVLEDIVNWSRQHDIPIGPGRGSAPASLVNYALGITSVDPIRFNLFFERFMDIHQGDFPDIMIDFCFERRSEVFNYVKDSYGKDKAVSTCTFKRRSFPAAMRKIGDIYGIDQKIIESILNMEPFDRGSFFPGTSIDSVFKFYPVLKEKIASNKELGRVLRAAWNLHGLICRSSVHEAGISLTNRCSDDAVPLCLSQAGEPISQWDGQWLKKLSIPYFDFLGLKNLTVNKKACELAESRGKDVPDLDQLPLDDSSVLHIFDTADTTDVFNFGGQGIRELLKGCAPNSFRDIVAINALYRPGPLELGLVDEFISCKHGKEQVKHQHSMLEPILKETYGLIIYQEQIMEIAQAVAKYTLEEANTLRKVLSKKLNLEVARHKERFIQNATVQNISTTIAEKVFWSLDKYTGFSFSKAHSVAYTMISYQSAYLKAHFPDEFKDAYEEVFKKFVSNGDS